MVQVPDRDSLEYLLQTDILEDVLPRVGTEQWQPLYISHDDESSRFGLWCALLDNEAAKRALTSDGWDLLMGDGRPGFSQTWVKGKTMTKYHRFGGKNGIRPLVHYRSFYGAFPKYCELDEEFRLYHNLAHDVKRGLLLDFDKSGREIEVVRLTQDQIVVRLKYLREFQAGIQLHLAIYIDSVRYSRIPLKEVGERHESGVYERGRWSLDVVPCHFRNEFATLS